AEDGIRDDLVTGVQTCALPISRFCCTAAHTSAWVNMASAVTTVPPKGGSTSNRRRAALCSLVVASTVIWAITAEACGAYAANRRSEERRVGKGCAERCGRQTDG